MATFNVVSRTAKEYNTVYIRIKNQPFRVVKIPHSDPPKKRFADVELVRKNFQVVPENHREELASDVCKMVIYLAGMNLIDLYNIEKQEFKNGKFFLLLILNFIFKWGQCAL